MRFILVDEILELVPGRSIKAVKSIAGDEPFFRDHFPGLPIVPGVLLTEMMGQAASLCLDAEKKVRGKSVLVQIQKASFREWMRPDQTAMLIADIKTNRYQYATASCYAEVFGRKVGSAELMFAFVPIEKFSPTFRNAVLEDYLTKLDRLD
jgi:3-hydroxyacyl-[acyl-carrier-protein] dehydratase